MRGSSYQVRLLLYLISQREAFTAPELFFKTGVSHGRIYPFLANLKRRGVVFPLPRPKEPGEWIEIYGWGVLQRKRREFHVIGPAPLALNMGRLRILAAEGCDDREVLKVLEEAEV